MRSWCFDSQAATSGDVTTYDREYGSSDIREVVGKLIGNGVYATPSTNMQVVADSGMNVRIQPGCCWISGAYGVVDTAETIAVTGTGTILIVARFDLSLSARSISLNAVTNLTRNASIYDIQLASIAVPSGTTSITQSMITDTRQNGTVCGIVTGVIDQIDTTNLFAQYQSSFNAFMATLENTLTGDVAGNLLTLINNHKNDVSNPHAVSKEQVGLGKVDNVGLAQCYGICSDSAASLTKNVNCTNFELKSSARILVRFINGHNADSINLNINNTGILSVYNGENRDTSDIILPKDSIVEFIKNGTSSWSIVCTYATKSFNALRLEGHPANYFATAAEVAELRAAIVSLQG